MEVFTDNDLSAKMKASVFAGAFEKVVELRKKRGK